MAKILQDLSELAEVNAIEENMVEFFRLIRQWSDAEVDDRPDLLSIITDIPFPLFNSILCAKIEPSSVDVSISRAITQGQLKKVPRLWWVGPSSQPADLARHLERHGFVHDASVSGMAIDLLNLNQNLAIPADLSVSQVKDIDTLKIWCEISATNFEFPDFARNGWMGLISSVSSDYRMFRHYLGYQQGKPVATSSLFYGAGVAGIYNVSTLPEARQQGIGTIMTLTPLLEAQRLGYRLGILHAADIALSIYQKLGFQTYCTIDLYSWTNNSSS